MYGQIREDTLFVILYAGVTFMALTASFYLLFRRANAIAPDVRPPARLRRWTAAFFGSIALSHLWYMPILFQSSSEDILTTDLIGGLLDSMTLLPLAIVVLLAMLQDRRRPLWPVAVMMAPIVAGSAWNAATRSYVSLPMVYAYLLLLGLGLIIYMVREVRRYSHWLRDNFADLEHKEVWQSFMVLAFVLLVFAVYAFIYEGTACLYAMRLIYALLICHLLWRVETLSDLCATQAQPLSVEAEPAATECLDNDGERGAPDDESQPTDGESQPTDGLSPTTSSNIETLLQQYCIDTRLYLQHDLTLHQLSKAVGTNRTYLSQYFSSHGITYNAYINHLRVAHFVSLYREAIAAHRSVTAQQLAHESGFRSYRTFSDAFKRKTGQSVTAWMKIQ